jgi:hypothetical protein
LKKSQDNPQGEIAGRRPIHISNVSAGTRERREGKGKKEGTKEKAPKAKGKKDAKEE